MRNRLLSLLMLCAACGDDAGSTNYDAGNGNTRDAPEFAPSLTSFQATPQQLPSGTPTMVTWNWTYAVEPTYPDPTCMIDNGVGPVTKGQMTSVTINSVTTFTIMCTNSAGTAQRQVVIGVPPSAPVIATFTATPAAAVTAGVAQNITFAWTYTGSPTPAPTCTVDGGIGAVTNGQTISVTLPTARTYRLRCTNTQGTGFRDAARIPVTECGTSFATCGNNSTCTDTDESYTCACAGGYTGDGNVCGFQAAGCTGNPSLCDTNADCISNAYCACKIGYTGSGAPGQCTRQKIAFITGPYAGTALGGLTGADAICATAASNQGLPGTYVAWLSDATNDAYCRVQGRSGKRSGNCGLGVLPADGGPWVRVETGGGTPTTPRRPFAPTLDLLTGTNRRIYHPTSFTEAGTEITSTSARVWTGTNENGEVTTANCTNWTVSGGFGTAGYVHGGSTTWTKPLSTDTDMSCSSTAYIRCMETGLGPALPPRHMQPATYKRAFITSVTGNGLMSSWPDSNGLTNVSGADQICQARARYVGYTNALNFKAWLSTSSGYVSNGSRIVNTTLPYVRPDGIVIGGASVGRSALYGSGLRLLAPFNQTELGTYVTGNGETGFAWTGMSTSGIYTTNCSSFSTASSFSSGYYGRHDFLDSTYITASTGLCDQTYRLYCVED